MKITFFIFAVFTFLLFTGCGKTSDNQKDCVVSFISAIEQHDMSKAWGLLGKNAQVYYNDMGERQRRSGKGALESEMKRIKLFKSSPNDYSVNHDNENGDKVNIVFTDGSKFIIETVNENGSYKVKDAGSVKTLMSAIAAETEKGDGY